MKNRSRTDIIADILRASLKGTNKTKLMYRSFLSYQQFKSYLEILVSRGLIEYDKKSDTYSTSAKGKAFLETLDALNEAIRIRKAA